MFLTKNINLHIWLHKKNIDFLLWWIFLVFFYHNYWDQSEEKLNDDEGGVGLVLALAPVLAIVPMLAPEYQSYSSEALIQYFIRLHAKLDSHFQ